MCSFRSPICLEESPKKTQITEQVRWGVERYTSFCKNLGILDKMIKMGSASPSTYLRDLNEGYKDDRKILQRRNREEIMKSYLILDDQLMQLSCDPRKKDYHISRRTTTGED
jgi:hypothetical protein